MSTLAVDWLSKKEPKFRELSKSEKEAILDFMIVWSYFEAHCMHNKASLQKIREYVDKLVDNDFAKYKVSEVTKYFQERYVKSGKFTFRYNLLHLEKSNNPKEVRRMLLNEAESDRERLIGCLGIIYRYRNNLFHGEKWNYQLREQKPNFEISTDLLLRLME